MLDDLIQWIAKDKLSEVVEKLLSISNVSSFDKETRSQIILVSGRLERLKKNEIKGLQVQKTDYQTIAKSLLEIINVISQSKLNTL